ncbi:MAG: type I-E CRISPR-associated endoribonuclease Cas2e [Desulfobaccales bacterium]|jgi:CRISPR-associated protein Cas2
MVVLILERVPVGLRGELTRWLLEPKSGVFVGSLSGMVRDLLWEKVCKEARGGGCTMIHTSNREQGFAIRMHGDPTRQVEDFEGLFLIRVP